MTRITVQVGFREGLGYVSEANHKITTSTAIRLLTDRHRGNLFAARAEMGDSAAEYPEWVFRRYDAVNEPALAPH